MERRKVRNVVKDIQEWWKVLSVEIMEDRVLKWGKKAGGIK